VPVEAAARSGLQRDWPDSLAGEVLLFLRGNAPPAASVASCGLDPGESKRLRGVRTPNERRPASCTQAGWNAGCCVSWHWSDVS